MNEINRVDIPLRPSPDEVKALEFDRRTALQRWEAWVYLVTYNYQRLYGRHPLTDLGEPRYRELLRLFHRDGVGHTDTARAIHATEVARHG